ncbi:MAG: hypothetical protein ACREJO_18310 [Phycisphaerales bacterium]
MDSSFRLQEPDAAKPRAHQLVRKTPGRSASLRVEAGDLVLWNCPDHKAPGFAVVGEASREFFSSARLTNECGYSHAFGLPGEYAWADANGSGLNGVVRVRDPHCRTEADVERWRRELTKGALVMIADGKAEPTKVNVVVGQTVFFAVVKADGVTVTDRRLLRVAG